MCSILKEFIDWCLTPTVSIFQLYRGVIKFIINLDNQIIYTNKRNIKKIKPYIENVLYLTICLYTNQSPLQNFTIVSSETFVNKSYKL
jgi:hypothetical protein